MIIVHMYTHVCRLETPPPLPGQGVRPARQIRVAAMAEQQQACRGCKILMCFLTGTFRVPICQHLSTSVNNAYLFPQSVRNPYFCSDPISVDPHLSATKGGTGARPGGEGPAGAVYS